VVRYERNPDYVFRQIVDEMVLVPIRHNVADMDCIYTLNSVGAFIWDKIDGSTTAGELQAAVADEFDADPAAVAADVEEFLTMLESAGAVRKV
jgi:hypothetical protein